MYPRLALNLLVAEAGLLSCQVLEAVGTHCHTQFKGLNCPLFVLGVSNPEGGYFCFVWGLPQLKGLKGGL